MDAKSERNRLENIQMTFTARRLPVFLLLALSVCSFAIGQSIAPSIDLPNLSKVNETLYRGGQPTEAGIGQLAAMGIKTVLDLRDNDGRAKREESWARAAGLNFINIPLSNIFGPKDAKIDEILKQIDLADNQPVFVHCKRGSDRTGTVIAVYRITHDSWTGDQATAEAKKFGLGWWQFWMKDYIEDYYRDHNSGSPNK
jgi:protein tyrosine phosphatase (PTP) superfamily phosphohydrolase (DUF442 family)